MEISLVVAAADNGVIGKQGKIPWRQPADQAYFRRVTKGHPIIMGRATYESIGRPLPDRQNIVVTHQLDYKALGCQVVHSVEEGLQVAQDPDEICIIGGGVIYEQSLSLANKIHLTRIHTTIDHGDAFFHYDQTEWIEVSTERHAADHKNQYDYTFSVLTRRK